MVQFHDEVRNIELDYYIDKQLLVNWDKLKSTKKGLIKRDEDRVYIVDGRERVGKSLFTFQQAKYIDPTFNLDRICFTPQDFLKQIRTAPQGSVIVFDEAFRGLSSKASQSKVNKAIVQAMMEMGQRNLIVFIVLPTIFLLELYPAVLRSNALFHIYKSKDGRRKFRVYNYRDKSQLYNYGRKKGFSYAIPKVKQRGEFYNKYPIDEASYRKKKLDSLQEMEVIKEEEENAKLIRTTKRLAIMYMVMHNKLKVTYPEIETYLKEYGESVDRNTINGIVKAFERDTLKGSYNALKPGV